ncbi:MAG: hypothetical protein MI747_12065 [Desulfobacterales bacterium]|nr:hypothetical protein [Desulfobacterales bacterium]
MSLSDMETNEFKPIDIGTLDNFDQEVSNRTDESEPDFDRFKALFGAEDEEDLSVFKTLHPNVRDDSNDVFEALIEVPDQENELSPEEDASVPQGEEAVEVEVPPEPTEAEKQAAQLKAAMEEARSQGQVQGMEEGRSQGYEEGFAKGMEEGKIQGEAEGRETGHAEGFAQGEAQGKTIGEEKAREEAQKTLDALSDSLAALNNLTNDLVDSHGEQLLGLVFQVTEKVIQAQVETQDDLVRETIIDALKTLVRPEEIELSVSPEDYEYIEMIKDSFFENISSLTHISVQSDPLVARGGCRIETATASVETDPMSKLDAVREIFLGTV